MWVFCDNSCKEEHSFLFSKREYWVVPTPPRVPTPISSPPTDLWMSGGSPGSPPVTFLISNSKCASLDSNAEVFNLEAHIAVPMDISVSEGKGFPRVTAVELTSMTAVQKPRPEASDGAVRLKYQRSRGTKGASSWALHTLSPGTTLLTTSAKPLFWDLGTLLLFSLPLCPTSSARAIFLQSKVQSCQCTYYALYKI